MRWVGSAVACVALAGAAEGQEDERVDFDPPHIHDPAEFENSPDLRLRILDDASAGLWPGENWPQALTGTPEGGFPLSFEALGRRFLGLEGPSPTTAVGWALVLDGADVYPGGLAAGPILSLSDDSWPEEFLLRNSARGAQPSILGHGTPEGEFVETVSDRRAPGGYRHRIIRSYEVARRLVRAGYRGGDIFCYQCFVANGGAARLAQVLRAPVNASGYRVTVEGSRRIRVPGFQRFEPAPRSGLPGRFVLVFDLGNRGMKVATSDRPAAEAARQAAEVGASAAGAAAGRALSAVILDSIFTAASLHPYGRAAIFVASIGGALGGEKLVEAMGDSWGAGVPTMPDGAYGSATLLEWDHAHPDRMIPEPRLPVWNGADFRGGRWLYH